LKEAAQADGAIVTDFEIHKQLLADCHRLGILEGCHLLLHRNAAVAWFILVPETEVADLLDLEEAQRSNVMQQAEAISGFIKTEMHYPKVNFAALGNVVPQMHLHIIGRRPGDACWPAPVWGHLADDETYSQAHLAALRDRLTASIGVCD